MSRNYRALSLDLWFTTVWFELPDLERWRKARAEVLQELLDFGPKGFPSDERLREAQLAVRRKFDVPPSTPTIDVGEVLAPATYLCRMAEELGARLVGDPQEAGRRYSDAGLKEAPPQVNAEAIELVKALDRASIPTIAVTNTGRLGDSWARFFTSTGGPHFRAIVTSCEVGVGKPSRDIFEEASRALGIPSHEILHVGDRWDIDVMGARGAGLGPALYRGLWPRYYDRADQELSLRLDDGGSDVLRIEQLGELLDRGIFSAGSPR